MLAVVLVLPIHQINRTIRIPQLRQLLMVHIRECFSIVRIDRSLHDPTPPLVRAGAVGQHFISVPA